MGGTVRAPEAAVPVLTQNWVTVIKAFCRNFDVESTKAQRAACTAGKQERRQTWDGAAVWGMN